MNLVLASKSPKFLEIGFIVSQNWRIERADASVLNINEFSGKSGLQSLSTLLICRILIRTIKAIAIHFCLMQLAQRNLRRSPLKLAIRPTIKLKPMLSLVDTIAIIVGVVIGASIFETPSFVAANAGSVGIVFFIWSLGGLVSLIGALCYAELATSYPHPGGTYYYLSKAFGKAIAFLFGWSRMTIIQTGSIALLAFIFGDYVTRIWSLGPYSSGLYAALAIVLLTGLNLLGVRHSKRAQTGLAIAQVAGLGLIAILGLVMPGVPTAPTPASFQAADLVLIQIAAPQNLGLMMVFVLLTYGGWNEAAYLSTEVRNGRQNLVRAFVGGIGIITALYLLINVALIRRLGLAQMAASPTVITDLMRVSLGETGAGFISALVIVTTLCSLNATIFTGARTNYALGRDFPLFTALKQGQADTPTHALVVQSAIALVLVIVGMATRQGFETMVGYTAPAFWFFFLLSGISLFVLRQRQRPDVEDAFRVPFYPWTPLAFCGVCVYMLNSSLVYTGWGGLLGVVVLLLGVPLLWWTQKRSDRVQR